MKLALKCIVGTFLLIGFVFRSSGADCLPVSWVWNAPTNFWQIHQVLAGENGDVFFTGDRPPFSTAFAQKYGGFETTKSDAFSSFRPSDAAVDDAGNVYWSYVARANDFFGTSTAALDMVDPTGQVKRIAAAGTGARYSTADIFCIQPQRGGRLNYLKHESLSGASVHADEVSFFTHGDRVYRAFSGDWIFAKEFSRPLYTESGTFSPFAANDSDLLIGHLDPFGLPVWLKQLGGEAGESLIALRLAADGIYIAGRKLAGTSIFGSIVTSTNAGGFVLKMNFHGDTIWAQVLPDISIHDLQVAPAGGCYVAGNYEPTSHRTGAVLLRLDRTGEIIADYTDGNGSPDDFISSVAVGRAALVIAGRMTAPGRIACASLLASGTTYVVATFGAQMPTAPSFVQAVARKNAVPVGGVIELSAAALGTPPFEYQWFHNGIPRAVTAEPYLVISNAVPGDAGNYSLHVVNSLGTKVSDPVTITLEQPLRFIKALSSKTVPRRGAATFETQFQSSSPASAQWRHNGRLLPGEIGAQLTITDVQEENRGRYSVTVTDGVTTINDSAILDIEAPFPATQLLRSQTFQTQDSIGGYEFLNTNELVYTYSSGGQVGTLPTQGLRAIDPSGTVLWQTKPDFNSQPYSERAILKRRSDGSIIVGAPVMSSQIFGTNVPAHFANGTWAFGEIPSVNGLSTLRFYPFRAGSFDFESSMTVARSFYDDNELLILNPSGAEVARTRLRFRTSDAGRSFCVDSAEVSSLSEFDATVATNSFVIGRYSLAGKPDWVVQLQKANFPFATLRGDSKVDDAVFVLLSKESGLEFELLKVGRGGVMWKIPMSSPDFAALRIFSTEFGGIIGFGAATNFRLASQNLPASDSQTQTMFTFTIDAGGFIRTLNRLPAAQTMVPTKLTRLGPSQYVSFHKQSKTALHFSIADPDVPPESPSLAAQSQGSLLRFTWPLNASDYHLKHTDDLNLPFLSTTTATVTTNSASNRIEATVAPTSRQRFFRLAKP